MGWQTTQPSLLDRLRDPGAVRAWREFDQRYGPLIVSYCRGRGLQLADAEDVRQIVLLNLTRAMPGFRYDPGRGRFRDYLGTCVRNAVKRHMRGHAAVTTRLPDLESTPEDGQDGLWEREWIRHHYRRALGSLRRSTDERSIEIFELLLQTRSAVDVARAFDTTPEAVRKIKQRVRERLRDLIGEQLDEERT